MKIRKLGNVIFFAVTLIVFAAGTIFTCVHRWDVNVSPISRENILAIAAACFLTVGELAFIFIHALLDSRDLWRRAVAYVLSLGLVGTITYASCTEAMSFMEEGNASFKTKLLSDFNKEQQVNAKSKRAQIAAIAAGQASLNETLKGFAKPDFTPFAVNFFVGLFVLLTGTLIQPREAWKRKTGNVMNDRVRAQAELQLGQPLPIGATAYDDGKGSGIKVQKGRQYLTNVSKRKIGF
jgi:uncharacterized membrane protein YdcZ (DUF606 family)